jgi:hypothetical protein
MKTTKYIQAVLATALGLCIAPTYAQVTTQAITQQDSNIPVYRVTVVERSIPTVNYQHRGGATKVDFQGTNLLPKADGEAKVESKQGYIEIEVEFDELEPAMKYGPEYLTYVMWAITPEGRATNLGEVILNGNRSKLNVTTELQTFGLLVTAEPHFAVTQPGNLVVLENVIRRDTQGQTAVVDAKYQLLERGSYHISAADVPAVPASDEKKTPREIPQARYAVRIAEVAGAQQYAADTYNRAKQLLAAA